ncbi:hypothetical protein EASAB2608_02123 [Streptomyces sp. EAS-AB2608]|nr:hypothetical protein EASAB2608_02123 [Streptomyces sp. EAS-AB2608]
MTGDEAFPASLDRWTAADWDEYADRVAWGEGSVRVMDAIISRRCRAESAGPERRREVPG